MEYNSSGIEENIKIFKGDIEEGRSILIRYEYSFLWGLIFSPQSPRFIKYYIDDIEGNLKKIDQFKKYIADFNLISWIDELFVDPPEDRRQGVGRSLVNKFIEISKEEGSDFVFCEPDLETEIGINNLIKFYQNQGFTYDSELILNSYKIRE